MIVGTDEAIDLSTIKATSSSPSDVSVRVETIIGGTGRALFVVRSASKKKGLFQIVFKLPCGKKELVVIVR